MFCVKVAYLIKINVTECSERCLHFPHDQLSSGESVGVVFLGIGCGEGAVFLRRLPIRSKAVKEVG